MVPYAHPLKTHWKFTIVPSFLKMHAYPHAEQELFFKTLASDPHDLLPFLHETRAFWPVFCVLFRFVFGKLKTVRLHFAINKLSARQKKILRRPKGVRVRYVPQTLYSQ